ncbi:MAG: hypothetical protein ABSF50_07195 [Burkholderiaceae bacterium]|jgi:hypothetical protein
MSTQRKPRTAPREAATDPRRGRKPQKAFINVLVRTSTRSALTRLKAEMELPSQGEVIDHLVADLTKRAKEQ